MTRPIHGYMWTSQLLREYTDGDGRGWQYEFRLLRSIHAEKLKQLEESILREWFQEPILLGDDGRVWDGHHRLCVADRVGLGVVPVCHAEQLAA